MNLKPEDVLFNVDGDGLVSLCVGPFYIRVCNSAKEFGAFHKALLAELDKIAKEIEENHL